LKIFETLKTFNILEIIKPQLHAWWSNATDITYNSSILSCGRLRSDVMREPNTSHTSGTGGY
jgi:hypothetical protein